MPVGLLPLCPTCLDRVASWTAASCPSCAKSSTVAECDVCQKSRAGAFLPEDGKAGGAQQFICSDCMEETLEVAVSDAMFNAVLAVGLAVVAVRWYGQFTWLPAATALLFGVAGVALIAWGAARRRQRAPKKRFAGAFSVFRKRVVKALARRPSAKLR